MPSSALTFLVFAVWLTASPASAQSQGQTQGQGDATPAMDPTPFPSEPPIEATEPEDEAPPPQAQPAPEAAVHPPVPEGALLDGHVRQGAFLAGPGSLTFIAHHTLMLAAGGLVTQGIATHFQFDQSAREAMLAGALVGAGLGFAVSAWWQFNHWIDQPMATFGVVNSIIGGMFMTGLADLVVDDSTALAWMGLIGAELGAWLTATLGGGEMAFEHGLLLASGAGWGVVYAALLMAIIRTSGTPGSTGAAVDTILMAPAFGAGLIALGALRYSPSAMQIMRANVFGLGVGAGVLLLSALVLQRFDVPTPYVLSLLSSAGAIAAVSFLWEESAERPRVAMITGRKPRQTPYRNWWW